MVQAEAAASSHLLGNGQHAPTDVLTVLIKRALDAILNRARSKS
jgi:hypothetical protein